MQIYMEVIVHKKKILPMAIVIKRNHEIKTNTNPPNTNLPNKDPNARQTTSTIITSTHQKRRTCHTPILHKLKFHKHLTVLSYQ